jgi:hypothetical protein
MSASIPSAPIVLARPKEPVPPMSISVRRTLPSARSSITSTRLDASSTGETLSFQMAIPIRIRTS